MADCPKLAGCPFFNEQMLGMDSIKEMMKRQYCRGDNSNCARFMVAQALGKEHVPADLIPNQTEEAERLISRGPR